MPTLDLIFPVRGTELPTDHAFPLYAALARWLPALHNGELAVAMACIGGDYIGNGKLALRPHSKLRLRLPVEQIPTLLLLAGKQLEIAGQKIRLGVPRVVALIPAPVVVARMVTIKGFTEPAEFLAAARRQLDELQIAGEPTIPLIPTGPRAGEPRRGILRIKDKCVVGFALQVAALTAEESIALQGHGLGGRRRMGCGFFMSAVRQEGGANEAD